MMTGAAVVSGTEATGTAGAAGAMTDGVAGAVFGSALPDTAGSVLGGAICGVTVVSDVRAVPGATGPDKDAGVEGVG